jgi:exodeoxyribonuclease V alpha subunit
VRWSPTYLICWPVDECSQRFRADPMIESRLVLRAKGLLKIFNEAGVLQPADVHVALRLQQLGGESAEEVLLAVALAVRAVRLGSVCVDLTRLSDVTVDEDANVDVSGLPWPSRATVVDALRVSPLVVGSAAGPLRPLRLVDTDEGELLYLDRYFLQEQTIRTILDERATRVPLVDLDRLVDGLDRRFGPTGQGSGPDRQRIAAGIAVTQWTTVIAGGPGTGKTHTVARILSLLFSQSGPTLRVGLCAPTGRAAAQLQQSVTAQTDDLGLPAGLGAMTVHRLLGWQRGSSSRFRHNASNHLAYDVVIVDETSMVSLTLMCRLLEAVRPDARLILVGDPDQLTSVDAGAVLADLVARPFRRLEGFSVGGGSGEPFIGTLIGAESAAVAEPTGSTGSASESEPAEPGEPPEPPLTLIERQRLVGGVVRLRSGRRRARSARRRLARTLVPPDR